jgi:septum formation protein
MEQPNSAPHLILASASPRRRELLQQARVAFTVVHSQMPEESRPEETPAEYVLRVAQGKARDVAGRNTGDWILGADTIVEIDGLVLGKPKDETDAYRMLRLLSGRTHRVMTAFVLLNGYGKAHTRQIVTSAVTFKPLSDEQIRAYLATGEPFDKAGAYAVQGRGATLVERVNGSYTNVVGLPIDEVLTALRSAGLVDNQRPQST